MKRNGKQIEERDSKLFKDIKKAVKDNETAWKMWAYTKTPEFKVEYKDQLEYDELGEVTFPSLIKALGLKDVYDAQKSAEEASRDYGFDNTIFENPESAVSKMELFNSKEKKLIASLHKVDGGYEVTVSPRNAQTIEAARKQSYNNALTGEIINLLQSMGFNVEWVSDPKFDGLFNPENAELHDGLFNIIQIAKGLRGEEALPEEFSHLMIEGLINHPLVQRLLNTLDDAQIREILGDNYERYVEQYGNDGLKMKKEAAGKLLAQHITGQGTISQPIIQPKKPLLSRIWNFLKSLFSKVKNEDLNSARERAHETVAGIYNLIATGKVVPLVDKRSILTAEQLYKLREEYDDLEKVAIKGETIVAKMLQEERREGNRDRITKTTKSLQKIKDLNESDQTFESIRVFLGDAVRHIEIISKNMRKAEREEESGNLSDIETINEIAKVVREIDTFIGGYEGTIRAIATFNHEDNYTKLGLDEDSAKMLATVASSCKDSLDDLIEWKAATERNVVLSASRTIYKDEKVRDIGSKRNEVMELEQILDHADRDINFVDRWLSAMSDADDAMLVIFDQIVKNQQYERDMEMIEWHARIAAADKKLRDAGYSSDFMYELDKDGVPTLRLISQYDWEGYNQAYKRKLDSLRKRWDSFSEKEKKRKGDNWIYKEMSAWKDGTENNMSRLIKVFVDPEVEAYAKENGIKKAEKAYPEAIFEMMPNPKVFTKNANRIEQLAPAQREYYEEMINLKRTMMTKIPHRGQGIYKAINISKDMVEGILDNSTGNPLKTTYENYKKKFLRRPDDIGFGTHDNFGNIIQEVLRTEKDSEAATNRILVELNEQLDNDIEVFIKPNTITRVINKYKKQLEDGTIEEKSEAYEKAANEILEKLSEAEFAIVDTDFANHRIQRLPIYYTRPLRDKKMLSTDFSSTIVAYSAMAVNYEKMNQVVDILEVGRNYIKERSVREREGQHSVMSRFTALGKAYKAYVERAGNGTNIAGRLDDYMDSVVYEERKNDEGSIELLGANVDVAKTLDAIKDYTGLLGLGFNLFSTISNIAVGKLQQWIEAAGGEYFTFKDYAKAVTQYSSLMPGCLAEMNSPVKKNKLSLLIQMFDPMGDYYESLRDPSFSKSAVSRILGNGVLAYIGMNAGEHMLHCQTMLAILNNVKLTNVETKEKISLYDALEVKEVNGIHKLILKPNLAYERELIDNTGNSKTNKNYGKPIRDEEGKIKTELVQISSAEPLKDSINREYTRQSRRMTERMHGTYEADEKPKTSIFKDFNNFIFKKKKVVRKVNDSLNGAFGANDKGALHKKAVGRLIMQFRQWMPAHYMRRFARAHYDADLEQWREGYYDTVLKTVNQIAKESWKAKMLTLKYYNTLSEHEKANLKRAQAEISEFLMLMVLVRLGGRVKDRDRSWLDKMALYQIRRMYLEVGASMPVNGGFFSNIFTLLQSPAASINTFEKFSKVVQFWNMFDEIQTGRFQGWSEWQRDAYQAVPAIGQIRKAIDFDDSMFTVFEKDN